MTGLVRKATLIVVCGMLAAATAFANVPSPGNSDTPDVVPVVGTHASGGASVPHNGETVSGTVRDFTNNPIANALVRLNFASCTETRICNAVIAGAGTVACGAPNSVTVTTNAAGQWSVSIVGAANSNGNGIGAGADCVEILANNVSLGNATAYVINIDGRLGGAQCDMDALDLSTVKADFNKATAVGGTYIGRIDYFAAEVGAITALDLSRFKALLNATAATSSVLGCSDNAVACSRPYCP